MWYNMEKSVREISDNEKSRGLLQVQADGSVDMVFDGPGAFGGVVPRGREDHEKSWKYVVGVG